MTRARLASSRLACALVIIAAAWFAIDAALRARAARRNVTHLHDTRARWRETVAQREAELRRAVALRIEKPDTPFVSSVSGENTAAPAPSAEDDRTLHLRALAADVQLSLDRFFRSRALPPEQAALVARRLAEFNRDQLLLSTQLPPAARHDITHPAMAQFLAQRKESQIRLKSDLTELLGVDGFAAYERFQETLPHWSHVTRLATQLFQTGDPLTSVQAAQLADLIIRQATAATGKLQRAPADWDAVFRQASGILSPVQLQTFQALKERTDLHQQLNRLIARERQRGP
jgi:hypothetical protein